MPAEAYINTPQTVAGDQTYMTNVLGRLDELSPEKSFASPSRNHDLIGQIQKSRRGNALNLKTPRAGARDPLRLLPNGVASKGEFTPLMKSVTKNNLLRRASAKTTGVPDTPAFLQEGYSINGATPALPKIGDQSQLYGDNTSSSAGYAVDDTPMPQNVSSSAHSTPLAQLPGRDGHGGVVGDGNMMTLKEQENIIDKIEKENFGLKMKIHFLEQAMAQRGNEFNQAALKENTELKVTRITMQRELHKFKKNIAQAERDAEVYRLQLQEYRERMKRKQADESVRLEVEKVHTELRTKEAEIEKLQARLQSAEEKDRSEIGKLRDEISDLEAEAREKDRIIEEKEDKIDRLKENRARESSVAAEVEEELETARRQIEELQEDLEHAAAEAKEAQAERAEAVDEKRKAEENLDELRDEMMNKSFTTRGLSRQLEEKANKMESQLQEMQDRNTQLQEDIDEKMKHEKKLQERLQLLEKERAIGRSNLEQDLQTARHEHDSSRRELSTMADKLRTATNDFQVKADEKDLLQSRHDALTKESASLQRELQKAQLTISEIQEALEDERQRAAQNEIILRSQHKTETDILTEQVDSLHREIASKESQYASDQDEWGSLRRSLEAASQKADERARGLQRTVNKLQETEGSLSDREMNLKEAFESEKERHRQEEQVLNRQIEELNSDLVVKREAFDGNRTELNNAKEELRISIRQQATLKETIEQLEEEIEVLQANLEEEAEFAEQQRNQTVQGMDNEFQKVKKEKQSLQDQLANVNIELHNSKKAVREAQVERDDLEARLQKAEKSSDDTFNVDQEKRELRRVKQNLEKDLARLKTERDSLSDANAALEQEINAEIDRGNAEELRLHAEIDQLRSKQMASTENRDRELATAKSTAQRMENRVRELENQLADQSRAIPSPSAMADVSILRQDLLDSRKKEAAFVKREAELKSSVRELRSRIAGLEGELHEMELAQLKSRSPSTSPPSHSKELAQLRKDLVDARAQLKDARSLNRDLDRVKQKAAVDDSERADLHALLKSSTLEAEALSIQLSEREGKLAEFKGQFKRLREERRNATQKSEAVFKELDALRARYEVMSEKGHNQRSSESKEKEMKGLMTEVHWLRARCEREERFRRDLAYGKEFMELGEMVRVACNEADLKMMRDMGIRVAKEPYETELRARQKLRAGVLTVMAAIRMSNLERQWRSIKLVGVELTRKRAEVESQRRAVGGKKM